jgi:hypothetical protein
LLAKLRDLQLTLAALGLWSPLVVAGANVIHFSPAGQMQEQLVWNLEAQRLGGLAIDGQFELRWLLNVDRLRRVLAVHAIQAGERLLASCSDANATRFQSWG